MTGGLERRLADHFRPEPSPAGFAARLVEVARAADNNLAEPLDVLAVEVSARGVAALCPGRQAAPPTAAGRRLVARTRLELAEYLAGQRAFFSVPLDLSGVGPFQRQVLEEARGIAFGEARTYAWVAGRIGHPGAVRAVGTALGRNPLPLLVPCHRVLRTGGGLGGYLFGLPVKARLLALERVTPVLEGCTSTRIVCRVGCIHGRHMRPDHRVVFASVGDARSVGYRPCRVCRPAA
jgi:O-6-methylguanine DNA methyltransferase